MKMAFWVALGSGPAALLLWWVASLSPSTVEAWYSRGIYPALMAPWSRLVGLLPVPVAPLIVVVLLALLIALAVFQPLRALAASAAALSVLVAWFVLGWGLNYQRLSWAESKGLVASGGTVADLESLAHGLAKRAGALREPLEVHPPQWGSAALREAVSSAWEAAGERDALLGGRYGPPKDFGALHLLSWAGIAGICIPHTGEALVNTGSNDWQLPFVAAHEAAHLRGWAREDEANYLAFLVLHDSPDGALAYSAWSSALLYVAQALEAAGPEGRAAWARTVAELDPRVAQDWRASFAYWEGFRGPVAEASRSINDVYLKSQGQTDGVKSYGRMVNLLLSWWKAAQSAPEPALR